MKANPKSEQALISTMEREKKRVDEQRQRAAEAKHEAAVVARRLAVARENKSRGEKK